MTLATRDTHFQSPEANKYILLTVEVKLTMDSLQETLNKREYYIFQPAPHPIRNLIIVNGGQVTRTWLFLISIAQMDFLPRPSRIDPSIYARSHEIAQRLAIGNTHVVYEQCVSSETFREQPLTHVSLMLLERLIALQKRRAANLEKTLGVSRGPKRGADLVKSVKECTLKKQMMDLIAQIERDYPMQYPRSSMNEHILLQPEMRTPRLLCYYEELSLSLLRERYRDVSGDQFKIRLPASLVEGAREERKRWKKAAVDMVQMQKIDSSNAETAADE